VKKCLKNKKRTNLGDSFNTFTYIMTWDPDRQRRGRERNKGTRTHETYDIWRQTPIL